MSCKRLAILGSCGSIGKQTLEVARETGIKIEALATARNIALLERQAREFRPTVVSVEDEAAAKELKLSLADTSVKVLCGDDGIAEAVRTDCDTVLNAIVGIAGLRPTLEAVSAGRDVALANKETLVAGGDIVTEAVKRKGVRLLPVDSEHSAIFQCLQCCANDRELSRIILTASGGPFFGYTKKRLESVTPEQALHNPNWSMGAKITVDSATLMNKGLEIIEAMRLFNVDEEHVDVFVHRQSIVHSMVEFIDGAVIAQLGVPDMKLPIQYSLTYPQRVASNIGRLTPERMNGLTFERVDEQTFTAYAACRRAARLGGLAPAAANGANERAVEMFLKGKIGFNAIGECVARAVSDAPKCEQYGLDDVFAADAAARERVDTEVF